MLRTVGSPMLTRRDPLREAIRPSQKAPRPTPKAETTPMPVMATRRISRSGRRRALGQDLAQRLDDLADTLHLLNYLIGNADIEFVFEREDQVDSVERIDAELLERRAGGNRGRVQFL